MALPKAIDNPLVPPLKCQGIKRRLAPFILASVQWHGRGRWVEPFLGSGVLLFNALPQRALACDINPHIIALYRGIQSGDITPTAVRDHLEREGDRLAETGPGADESYYYQVRQRFNDHHDPLDYLFLNRSCFNGMVRFNQKGGFNVPFCRKPNRFRKAYITRICNQVEAVQTAMEGRDWHFEVASWQSTLHDCTDDDFVYLDPPYIGRHTGYFNTSWTDDEAASLADTARQLPGPMALSMWKENRHRSNDHLDHCWDWAVERTEEHFYHLGATESLRNAMTEALMITPGAQAPLPTPAS